MTIPTPQRAAKIQMPTEPPLTALLRGLFVVLFDVGAAWFLYSTITLGYYQLAVVLGIITVLINLIFILPQAYPFRWMAIGFAFLILFVIYPILFTVYVAFTNYGDGHFLTKDQVIAQIEKVTYLPASGTSYSWTAYKSEAGVYALWLVDTEGNSFLAKPGEAIVPAKPGDPGIGEADSKGLPKTLTGYQKIGILQATIDKELPNIIFGLEGKETVQIRSPKEAAFLALRYKYDSVADTVTDQQNGDIYLSVAGTYTTKDGKTITPGFREVIGLGNYIEFATSPALRGPLVQIFTWNLIFPALSVASSFGLGLAIAVLFNDKDFPLKRVIRSFLLIPYTIPAVITILIWKGMLNTEFGVVNRFIEGWFGWAPPWTSEPIWAQTAVVLVNLWLSYPYFMLISSGALQSISSELYEAAVVDGASPWQRFRSITFPLLLVAVGPLLVASYVFNFNNFNIIYLFIGGGPSITDTTTVAGHTDLLISYVYKLAFASGGRGVQYGYASAISIIVFLIVGTITLMQFRFTNMWEEVGENV